MVRLNDTQIKVLQNIQAKRSPLAGLTDAERVGYTKTYKSLWRRMFFGDGPDGTLVLATVGEYELNKVLEERQRQPPKPKTAAEERARIVAFLHEKAKIGALVGEQNTKLIHALAEHIEDGTHWKQSQ